MSRTDDVVRFLAVLNQGISESEAEVPNFIVVGFMEWLLADTPLDPLLQGGLKEWRDFHNGVTEKPPVLRSGK
ncbi:hypothetical protein ACXR2T_09395 [Leucobacter sp. HY1910]